MARTTTTIFCLVCFAATCAVRIAAQSSFTSISVHEMELLLADISKTNPALAKRLADDPQLRKQQVESLKQLLAFASQAQKDGLANDPIDRQELENIRAEVLALNYDKEINQGKPDWKSLASIPSLEVQRYLNVPGHEAEFEKFLETKLAILRSSDPTQPEQKVTDDERAQARDIFARTRIYLAAYESAVKRGVFSKESAERADLQVKLQQAQFLARLYSEKTADGLMATDADVNAYIAAHPDLDTAAKRALAQKILDRARAGEDFAKLANEFSQDPGNQAPDGTFQGGLYRDVPKGRMIPAFEDAALALKPGEISPKLVETEYGFHIIKLDRKLEPAKPPDKEGQLVDTYDVRHILISTGIKDPEDPNAREVPVKEFVRSKLETEKQKRSVDELVASNHIQVPEDFVVPKAAETPVKVQAPRKKPAAKRVTHRTH